MSTIEVMYALYQKKTQSRQVVIDVVTDPEDLDLETKLRTSDPTKEVDSYATVPAQIAALHEYVQAVDFEFPVLGHTIAFGAKKDTRWDPGVLTWVTPIAGGAIAYPVPNANETAANARLHLAVWTKGALGDPDRPA